MGVWGEHDVEGKIIRILRETPYQASHYHAADRASLNDEPDEAAAPASSTTRLGSA
jgi:hypothetical protein